MLLTPEANGGASLDGRDAGLSGCGVHVKLIAAELGRGNVRDLYMWTR